jgi:hypothetical protein
LTTEDLDKCFVTAPRTLPVRPAVPLKIRTGSSVTEKITILEAAMKVHTTLGPGPLESFYPACLFREPNEQGLKVLSQVGLPSSPKVKRST